MSLEPETKRSGVSCDEVLTWTHKVELEWMGEDERLGIPMSDEGKMGREGTSRCRGNKIRLGGNKNVHEDGSQ